MSTSTYSNTEPMDLSNAVDEGEAELQVAEQQHDVQRCYTCGRIKHLSPTCHLRKQRQTPMTRNPGPI